ncbi:hypothetical protein HOR55_gp21 [Ralstonia phage RS-PII-1]|uniref:Uncharacterized protein n=1 Tax=Ralstonia phage RS-PII-1 TaxID=1932892 RepID=A0A1L7DQB1_9CAUD|nr:hypothetical protein HOR55_gp21 [Ralstonia phage RS-PII-1]APU00308.1 hypothetical protein [Ralstonia phage RS-PII-1]
MLFPADYTTQDWADIERSVHTTAREVQTGRKAWVRYIDPHHVFRQIREQVVESVIVEGYLIVFCLSGSWFSPDSVFLGELMVMRIRDTPGSFRVVPETLLRIARSIPNCAGIQVGTALARDGRLARVYKRYGFEHEADSLFRSI